MFFFFLRRDGESSLERRKKKSKCKMCVCVSPPNIFTVGRSARVFPILFRHKNRVARTIHCGSNRFNGTSARARYTKTTVCLTRAHKLQSTSVVFLRFFLSVRRVFTFFSSLLFPFCWFVARAAQMMICTHAHTHTTPPQRIILPLLSRLL